LHPKLPATNQLEIWRDFMLWKVWGSNFLFYVVDNNL